MGYTVSVNHPNFKEGVEFNVGNLGRIPNGDSMEVDEETERLFLMSNGVSLEDAFANDHAVTVSGSSSLTDEEVDSIKKSFVGREESVIEQPQTPSWLTTEGAAENEGGDD